MKKLLLLLSVFILSIPIEVSAQYRVAQAFPNLPVFSSPIEMVHAYDGTNRLFVAQQYGLIYVFDNNPTVSTRKTFMNLTSKVTQGGSETGLLGIAFHPDFETNRYFFISYTFDSSGAPSGTWSRLSRFTVDVSNPDTARLNTEYIIMTVPQPYSNHNGGKIAFGNDNYLYYSLGDGGSGGDPLGNGQNRTTLLGKILRINIDSAGVGRNYSIPVTNPYYGNTSGWKEEIYAWGLRNVWKFNFDYHTNTIWAGDVGQGAWEEVDIIESGKNYGWNKMEGFQCYGTCDTTGKGFTRPIWNYSHSLGISITGGFVYRGSNLPGLYGKYLYADYLYGSIWALTYDGVNPATNVRLWDTTNNVFSISSFGVDASNEVYVVRYGSSGRIYKLVDTTAANLNVKLSIEGFYNTTADRLNIRDTVSVYVRQNVVPFALVDSSRIVIDSVNFSGLCIFKNTPNGKYYLQVKHRNALEVWSREGGDSIKRSATLTYDFTNDSAKTYGSNSVLLGSKYNFYSGDISVAGVIDLNDITSVYNSSSDFSTGYISEDVTGDNLVNLNDLSIIYNNASKFISVKKP